MPKNKGYYTTKELADIVAYRMAQRHLYLGVGATRVAVKRIVELMAKGVVEKGGVRVREWGHLYVKRYRRRGFTNAIGFWIPPQESFEIRFKMGKAWKMLKTSSEESELTENNSDGKMLKTDSESEDSYEK